MRLSTITTLAALGLSASALPVDEKRQTNKFDKCTNFGDEWCNDGEILTCKQIPFTDQGWAKSTHKTCSAKRQTEKFDKCFNYGEEWCSDGEVLTCKKVPFVDQGRVKSTHKTCAAKRDVGDWCDKNGVTWCQDYQILTCSNYRITPTGSGCGTKRSIDVEARGWKPDINVPTPPVIPKPVIPVPPKPFGKRDVGDPCGFVGFTWCQDYQILTCTDEHRIEPTGGRCNTKRDAEPQITKPIIPPVIIPPMPPVIPKPVIPVPPKPFGKRDVEIEARGWKPDINVPTKPQIPKPEVPEVPKRQVMKPAKRDVGDRCDKLALGKTWCQDFEVLECADVEGQRWGVIKSTGVACGT